MSLQGRRSSLLNNIDEWLDKCTDEEPDSIIYDPEYPNEVATVRSRGKQPLLEALYKVAADSSTRIGFPAGAAEERLNDIDEFIETCCSAAQKHILEEEEKLCQYKQQLLDQIQKMLKDLYLPAYEADENLTLLQHCKRLKTKFNELNVVKQKRMARLQELRDKQTRHSIVLGIKPPQIKLQTDIPTEEELVKLATAVLEMEKEERRRKEKFTLLTDLISKCMDQVEYVPQTEFEQSIFEKEPNYTEAHMTKMSNLHSKLETLYATNHAKFEKLKERLVSLYDRLDVGQEERKLFLETHSVCKPSLMVEMEVEIERFEELKRQNIGKFIDKIKEELVLEYERCYVSQDQQDQFFSLSNVSGDCNEELLELYERELERMKEYYQQSKEMLEKFQSWRSMWRELIDLEVKGNDPNRFNNRGGQLLIEEKKRKALQKGLPKVEKELMALNEKYSTNNQGNKFRVFDTNLDEFIAGCWDELNNAKEQEKRERQRAKMTTDTTMNRTRIAKPAAPLLRKTPAKRLPGRTTPGVTPTPSKIRPKSSHTSALSISEAEFEDMILNCPTSAKRV